MSVPFEELAYGSTSMGELSLRRRIDPALGTEVFEVKLGDEFLMSSLFTEGEIKLAELALAELPPGPVDVLVGGLGLGYTARSALNHPNVRSVLVIEALVDVITWHQRGLVPLGKELTGDPRCRFLNADFFSLLNEPGMDDEVRGKRFHAILVDIDHSPRHTLHPGHAALYVAEGLKRLAAHMHPGGVFALWSNDRPDPDFSHELGMAFPVSSAHVVPFHNPLQHREAYNTVYLARTAHGSD